MADNSITRVDVLAKALGKAKYTEDIKFDNMLYIKVVRCPHPHARVIGINKEKALAIEGVVAVLTATDIPGLPCQPKERPILVPEIARYAGDGVALVVAESPKAALEGAEAVRVEYELLEAVFDPEEALKTGAPLVHGDNNVAAQSKVCKGDVEAGFKEADLILEREYNTHRVEHAPIEPEVAIAVPTFEGITVYCPTNSPFQVRQIVAETMAMPQSQIRLFQPTIGGSFGSKCYDAGVLASRAALAAKLTGRPCKIVYTREESIVESTKRHPYKMKYKVGVKKNGKLTAMEVKIIGDSGAYKSKTPFVISRSSIEATGPYVVPNVHTEAICVYTNNVTSCAMRGFGSPQVAYASELLMDELAEKLGIDPLKFRRINGLKDNSLSATGQVMQNVTLDECLDKLEQEIKWSSRKAELKQQDKTGSIVKGLGLACMYRGESFGSAGQGSDYAGATLQVQRDGSITLYSAMSEVGQGGHTMLVRVVSEVLGIKPSRIFVSPVDTCYVPDSGPTVATRGTYVIGNAIRLAAEEVKAKFAEVAAEELGVRPEELVFKDERIYCPGDPSKSISFSQIAAQCYLKSKSPYGYGWWSPPVGSWDREKGQGEAYSSYVYGACAAEVELDLDLGKVEVMKFVAVHDVGKALDKEEVKGQIAGGVSMGIGYALMEDLVVRQGVVKTVNFDEYLLPTSLDIHEIIPVIVEQPSSYGPLGAKGLGEPVMSAVAPAILNAIADALGTRVYDLPANLEAVLDKARAAKGRCCND